MFHSGSGVHRVTEQLLCAVSVRYASTGNMSSQHTWNRLRSPRRTPAVTGPEWIPIRIARSPVSGPRVTSSFLTSTLVFSRHSLANRHTRTQDGEIESTSGGESRILTGNGMISSRVRQAGDSNIYFKEVRNRASNKLPRTYSNPRPFQP